MASLRELNRTAPRPRARLPEVKAPPKPKRTFRELEEPSTPDRSHAAWERKVQHDFDERGNFILYQGNSLKRDVFRGNKSELPY